ncbi:MAG: hypothetical protein NZM06_01475 [Chloroherpetonaceae bacterium]|nr:hypothetical protein [Chloroherpetonaceae bacterium]MDW8436665.1 hypothetical protein [Chloroherpetonaceae bacterium]
MKHALALLCGLLMTAFSQAQSVVCARQAALDGHFFAPLYPVPESIVSELNECYRFTYQDASQKRLLRVERLFRGKLSDELSQINAAKAEFKYDAKGNLTEKRQLDAQGKTQSVRRFRYKNGQVVEEALFDGANKLFSRTLFRYDKQGRLIEIAFVDDKNRRQNTSLGYAIERREYDEKGRPTLVAWFDHYGDLSRKTYTRYDDKGNAIELRHVFFPDTTEFQIVKFQYDANGRWTEKIETDSKGSTFQKTLRRYDANGNLIEEATYDNLGRLVENVVEIARTVIEYRDGKKIRERCYNAANVLRTDAQYGEFGQIIERAQYASDGSLLEIKRAKYDDFGNVVEETFFAPDKKKNEIPVETRRYEKGKLIQRIRYGKDGKPL